MSGEPSSLDPAFATDSYSIQVITDLYEGLTVESADGSIIPGVASSWTIESQGTRYIFQLRSNARWSNGELVRARDFVLAWRRVVDPKQGSPVADDLRLIAGASSIISGKSPPESLGAVAISDNLLMVKLERPANYLPQVLANSAALPRYSGRTTHNQVISNWVSNGPYVLSEWRPGTQLRLAANANYWDHENVQTPIVEYQFNADDNAQYDRYRTGQIDVTDSVPVNALAAVRSKLSNELVIAPYLGTAYYGLNFATKELASKIGLRKALAMAIDRTQLVKILGFGQTAAYGFVSPGIWNYQPQTWQWAGLSSTDRIAEAKRLYSQAGFTSNSPLRLRLLLNSNPVIKRTALLIASMWKETLGVETEFTEEEYRVFLESRHDKSRWDIARLAWTADFNDASNFLDVFRSHSPNNDFGYSNPDFDLLVEQADTTADPQKRRQLLQSAEQVMLDDYPVIPLYFFVSKRLVKPYVLGVRPSPLDHLPSKNLRVLKH